MTSTLMGTEHYVYRRDGRVYLRKIGGGEPLLFLHPVGSSGWSWRKVVDKFAKRFACYIVTLLEPVLALSSASSWQRSIRRE